MITSKQTYAHARPAIHAETDGFLESSVSAPIMESFRKAPYAFVNWMCLVSVKRFLYAEFQQVLCHLVFRHFMQQLMLSYFLDVFGIKMFSCEVC